MVVLSGEETSGSEIPGKNVESCRRLQKFDVIEDFDDECSDE